MPNPIRFHLDENVDHAIAYGLRRHGIDVTVTSEVGLLQADDDEQLAFARDNARVIVTHDEDFLLLHSQGIPNRGLFGIRVYVRSDIMQHPEQSPIRRSMLTKSGMIVQAGVCG
jgi:Domain of unknown function (DUF5615)